MLGVLYTRACITFKSYYIALQWERFHNKSEVEQRQMARWKDDEKIVVSCLYNNDYIPRMDDQFYEGSNYNHFSLARQSFMSTD